MPAPTPDKKLVKRKRDLKRAPPRKRTRSESLSDNENGSSSEDIGSRILRLESEIFENKKNYNNIVTLIGVAGSQDCREIDEDDEGIFGEAALTAAVTLCRVFLRLLAAGSLSFDDGMSDKGAVVIRWLRERLVEYEQVLLRMLVQSGGYEGIASTALTLAMGLVQAESQYLKKKSGGDGKGKETAAEGKVRGKKKKTKLSQEEGEDDGDEDGNDNGSQYYFPRPFLNQLVKSLLWARQTLGIDGSEELLEEFATKYAGKYTDIRFYTFQAVATAMAMKGDESSRDEDDDNKVTEPLLVDSALHFMSLLDAVPVDSKDGEDNAEGNNTFYGPPPPKKRNHSVLHSTSQQKKQAQQAWIALLQRATSKAQRKHVLGLMSTVIAPWFSQPELLLDYLTDCYDAGGSTSLLALSGLWFLIRERNVDYPAFYRKLYSLLDADLLHSKHRSRFLRLMDTFLASTHLPSQLVASFIKRLARLSLNAPPAAIVSVVPWMYNMFKKHPLCTFMLHRVQRPGDNVDNDDNDDEGMDDPFQTHEADPMKTQAIDSCLWEIVQLQSHFHPNVATIAKIISEQFTKQAYNVEDFLDHSYQSMFEAEIKKDIKKEPVVEFHIPKRIFLPQDPESNLEDSLLVKLWDFA